MVRVIVNNSETVIRVCFSLLAGRHSLGILFMNFDLICKKIYAYFSTIYLDCRISLLIFDRYSTFVSLLILFVFLAQVFQKSFRASSGCNDIEIIAFTTKITSFSECIFCVYLIPWWNQKISLYLVWKSIICSIKSLLKHPYIYFLKGEIHVLNLNKISVIRIDSLLIFASQNWFVEIKTRSTTFIFWPRQDYQPFEIKNNNECLIFCNSVLQKE